ncbi:MAG: tetratricopeptide repeat protein [Thermoguttaceae bacterium]
MTPTARPAPALSTSEGRWPAAARRWGLWVSLGLVLLVAAVYCRGAWNAFVLYDDDEYIYTNPVVRQGLTWAGVRWAFEAPHHANYHPLTWISHMLDWQCFGPWAGGHHLVSLAIHAASAVVLFWALRLMTGALWSSAAVAALFALHPLHVESVAWASERKDVLSGLFWMVTLLSYAWYARRPGVLRYALVFLAMGLGLLCKSMLVSLPCVLLLLDIWPLGRWRLGAVPQGAGTARAAGSGDPRRTEGDPRRTGPAAARRQRVASRRLRQAAPAEPPGTARGGIGWLLLPLEMVSLVVAGLLRLLLAGWRLLLEKVPLVALAAAASAMALRGQREVFVVSDLKDLNLYVRVANAAVAYVSYLGKMIWPARLAAFYPHPGILGGGMTRGLAISGVLAGLVLAAVTGAVLWTARRRPYAAVGWFWYLGALVPAIGLVQVGTQGMADRYTYLPLVGIYIAIVWTAKETAERWPRVRTALAVAGPAVLAAYALLAWIHVGYWRDTYALFEHAIRVTDDNYLAYNSLGRQYRADKKLKEAADQFQKALDIKPDYDFGNNNLGVIYVDWNELDKADECFQRALKANGNYADVCSNLAQVRVRQAQSPRWAKDPEGQKRLLAEALQLARRGVDLRPDIVNHIFSLATVYRARGEWDHAAETLRWAIRSDPAYLQAYFDLLDSGLALKAQNRPDEAIAYFQQLLRAERDSAAGDRFPILVGVLAGAHESLAALYAQQGDAAQARHHRQEAIARFERLLGTEPGNPAVHQKLALLYQQDGDAAKAGQHERELLRIQGQRPPAAEAPAP